MKGIWKPLTRSLDGKYLLSFEVEDDPRPAYEALKDSEVDIEVKKHRNRRSLDANAYFHVLVNKIAAVTKESDAAVKKRIVQEYGTVDRDSEGNLAGIKLPITLDIDKYVPYARWFDRREENGHWFNCYLLLKPTHEMDSTEMSRVINGAVEEAKELGIETLPPHELARMLNRFKPYMRGRITAEEVKA